MQMQTILDLAPSPGFRKAIPVTVKLQVVIRQHALCATCGERLGKLDDPGAITRKKETTKRVVGTREAAKPAVRTRSIRAI